MTAITVSGTVGLTPTDASTLSGVLAGYLVSFTEATGLTPPAPLAVPLNGTSYSVALEPGTWTPTLQNVDATGAAIGAPVVGAAYVVTAPTVVTVNLATSVTLGAPVAPAA